MNKAIKTSVLVLMKIVLMLLLSFEALNGFADQKFSKKELNNYKKKYIKTRSNLDLFNYANALYLSEDYKKAYKGYRLVIKKNSSLKSISTYYLSLCLIKLKRKKMAYKVLRKLIRGEESLKPAIKSLVKNKIKELKSGGKKIVKKSYLKRKKLSVSAGASLTYSSNPALDSEDELSFDEVEASGELGYNGSLGISLWLFDSLKFDQKVSAFLQYNAYLDRPDLLGYNISASLPTSVFVDLFRLRLTPTYSQEFNDEGALITLFGGSIEIARKFKKGLLSVGYLLNVSSPLTEDFDYLNGTIGSAFVEADFRLDKFSVGLFTEYLSNSYEVTTQDENNSGYQGAVKVSYNLSSKFSVDLQLRIKKKSYNETSIFFDDGTKTFALDIAREDDLREYSFGFSYLFSKLSLDFEVSHLENKSTFDSIFTDVGDKNYTVNGAEFGLRYFF